MPTERLHYDDPLRLTFTARVVAHGVWDERPSVILDRTAFYPEAGGQMADRGVLAGVPVADVQVDDAGAVHHVLDGAGPEGSGPAALPAVGSEVEGAIDRARRRVHMALHTGQHMLSRALVDEARGETVSSRLGETACTIDIDREKVDERELQRAEDLCNAVIDDDVAIRAFFPTESELTALPLRRAPKVSEHVRVIQIGDYDVSPCGGTHCLRSSQVGLVRVTGVERYKGKLRLTFVAGRRAREELFGHDEVLLSVGRELRCPPLEVPAAISRLRRETEGARLALGAARARLTDVAARELAARARAEGTKRVVATFDDADVDFLRAVARPLAAAGLLAFLSASTGEGQHVVVAGGGDPPFDCGAFLKRAAAATGGRGGGRKESAEGRVPRTVDWAALVARLLDSDE